MGADKQMDEDRFNMALRKFLKEVGVTSQRAIEDAVAKSGAKGSGKLTVRAVVTAEAIGLNHIVESEIDLG